jgi:hypothetical protein
MSTMAAFPENSRTFTIWVALLDENSHFPATHTGHHDIADNQLRAASFDSFQRALSVVERSCLVPRLAEYYYQRVGYTLFVIDNEYLFRQRFSLSMWCGGMNGTAVSRAELENLFTLFHRPPRPNLTAAISNPVGQGFRRSANFKPIGAFSATAPASPDIMMVLQDGQFTLSHAVRTRPLISGIA